jgi:hypothetical protein
MVRATERGVSGVQFGHKNRWFSATDRIDLQDAHFFFERRRIGPIVELILEASGERCFIDLSLYRDHNDVLDNPERGLIVPYVIDNSR